MVIQTNELEFTGKTLQDNLLPANKQSIVLKNRRENYYRQLAKHQEKEITENQTESQEQGNKIENMPPYKTN